MTASPPDFPNLRRLRRAEMEAMRHQRAQERRLIVRIGTAAAGIGLLFAAVLVWRLW
jgi:hypothetical protein